MQPATYTRIATLARAYGTSIGTQYTLAQYNKHSALLSNIQQRKQTQTHIAHSTQRAHNRESTGERARARVS